MIQIPPGEEMHIMLVKTKKKKMQLPLLLPVIFFDFPLSGFIC